MCVTREVAAAEGIAGGFGAVYDVLKALEDQGRVRRGYFVGVGATQFALACGARAAALPARAARGARDAHVAATDTANPYGTTLKWPAVARATEGLPLAARGKASDSTEDTAGRAPTRTVGALVILVNGALAAYLPRGGRQVVAYLPEDEPARSMTARAAGARACCTRARQNTAEACCWRRSTARNPREHPLAPFLIEAGFNAVGDGIPDAPVHFH